MSIAARASSSCVLLTLCDPFPKAFREHGGEKEKCVPRRKMEINSEWNTLTRNTVEDSGTRRSHFHGSSEHSCVWWASAQINSARPGLMSFTQRLGENVPSRWGFFRVFITRGRCVIKKGKQAWGKGRKWGSDQKVRRLIYGCSIGRGVGKARPFSKRDQKALGFFLGRLLEGKRNKRGEKSGNKYIAGLSFSLSSQPDIG